MKIRLDLRCLDMNNYKIIFILILILGSCGTKSESQQELVNKYLKEQHQTQIDSNWKGIIVFTFSGCYDCNRQFIKGINEQTNLSKYAVLVSASPGMISPKIYEKKDVSIILKDYQDKFHETKLLKSSGIIYLENAEIDTIIDIRLEQYSQQLKYVSERFKTD